jgi:hypothetical protein
MKKRYKRFMHLMSEIVGWVIGINNKPSFKDLEKDEISQH